MEKELLPEILALLTKEQIDKIITLLNVVDSNKVKAIMDLIEVKDGKISIVLSSSLNN